MKCRFLLSKIVEESFFKLGQEFSKLPEFKEFYSPPSEKEWIKGIFSFPKIKSAFALNVSVLYLTWVSNERSTSHY